MPARLPMTQKKRILVVDDQASDSLLVKQCLEQTGDYEVLEINNVWTVSARVEEFGPHLILLDVRMPGIDGFELAASLHNQPGMNAVPIVFMTALVTKTEVESGNGRVGGFPVLAKPILLEDLVAEVKRHLGG